MSVNLANAQRPVLDEATRSFVRRALAAGLVELDDLKKVVISLMSQSSEGAGEEASSFTQEKLADGLVHAGVLTKWQSSKLLAGCSKGFYLGSYRLLRPLGKGGMGVVYLGEHHVMKRMMALKILPPEATEDPRRIERFKSEARACAQLDHPNIIRAYDFAEAGKKLYIVIEYVDGIDLQRAVQRDGVMSVADAVDVLQQTTAGLAHAHERGIVHRDIKPSNLMLRTDGVLKVSDLGLARIGWSQSESQEKQRLMGTADFIAPEQAIDSTTAGTHSDIYSLGCTFYFLLAGKPPFLGSATQRLAKHQAAPVPDIRDERADCPSAIAELLKRMMAKRPADRPKSAVELLAQLTRLVAVVGEPSRRSARSIEPLSDTAVDDAVYQATLDDTSLSADGDVVIEVDEFIDFEGLPPIDLGGTSHPVVVPALQQNAVSSHSDPASYYHQRQPSKLKQQAEPVSRGNGTQQVLLGVGLAFAILALIAVLALAIYSFVRPDAKVVPAVKSLENGNVVIVRE
ncbi:MAG: serine/threonine-protein kinase [Rubripirellula sp.]